MMEADFSTNLGILVDPTDAEFVSLAKLVYDQFGINLTDKKKALVRGRLNKVLKTRGLKTFGEYLEVIRHDQSGMALVELIDRISTNHTFFFREVDHFTFFQTIALDELGAAGEPEIRIWCAGCATGEEAYTLAMLCREWADQKGFRGSFKILATDISVTALEHAAAGEYNDERVRLIPQILKKKYLEPVGPDRWLVSGALKKLILFKRLNFMTQTFPFKHQFHGIFCRNVMIYFDRATKNALVQKLSRQLEPGRYLFIGHSETLGKETFGLDYVQPSIYRRTLP